eukprot:GILI01018116.1.p2 GENE.GILI01018116.1~~GILI01018116.1.p2  ORF type:complete len:208 (+),score=17.90 GILI01018116.1:723-1346(+)
MRFRHSLAQAGHKTMQIFGASYLEMSLDLYNSANFAGYSLWLRASGETQERCRTIVKKYASPLHFDSLTFEPHVTLLAALAEFSEEEVFEKCAELSRQIRPFTVTLSHIEAKDLYFQCVFARVEETADVMGSNQCAREVFNRHNDPSFMPHMSLVYGNFPMEKKLTVFDELNEQIRGVSFEVDCIELWNTEGPCNTWTLVKSFPLTS